jgi:hypothetical protein
VAVRLASTGMSLDGADARWHVHGRDGRHYRVPLRDDDVPLSGGRGGSERHLVLQLIRPGPWLEGLASYRAYFVRT